MTEWTYEDIARVRCLVQSLLEELRLDAYLFGVEPRDDGWEVRIEYAVPKGWRSSTIVVDDAELSQTANDGPARRRLFDVWRRALQGAKLTPPDRSRAARA